MVQVTCIGAAAADGHTFAVGLPLGWVVVLLSHMRLHMLPLPAGSARVISTRQSLGHFDMRWCAAAAVRTGTVAMALLRESVQVNTNPATADQPLLKSKNQH